MMRDGFELYLVRHAIAAERGEDWPDDRLRPLTRAGIARFKEVARALAKLNVVLDIVYTSPLTRARQTAELLVAGLPGHPELRLIDALAPGEPPRAVLTVLRASPHRVALVGHEPDLGGLAALLLGTAKPLAFKKGGVGRIDLTSSAKAGQGSLVWFAPPKLLRR